MTIQTIKDRLEYLRGEILAERISYGEIAELQSLADHIDTGDVLLLEWAGVPEHNNTCLWNGCGLITDNACRVCDRCQQLADFDGTDFSNNLCIECQKQLPDSETGYCYTCNEKMQ